MHRKFLPGRLLVTAVIWQYHDYILHGITTQQQIMSSNMMKILLLLLDWINNELSSCRWWWVRFFMSTSTTPIEVTLLSFVPYDRLFTRNTSMDYQQVYHTNLPPCHLQLHSMLHQCRACRQKTSQIQQHMSLHKAHVYLSNQTMMTKTLLKHQQTSCRQQIKYYHGTYKTKQ